MSVLFAATYPERTWGLVLFGSFPKVLWAPDYPWGESEELRRRELENDLRSWTDPARAARTAELIAPSADEESKRALAVALRQSASPGAVEALHRMNTDIDVRHVLPAVAVPTLVMNRVGDAPKNVGGSRYLAEHISGARHVEFPGSDHAAFAGDSEPVVHAVEQFLTAVWETAAHAQTEPDRVLATVLFTDIVGATAKAAELGDRAWRALVAEHHATVRRELARFRGREIDTAGDGFFASFDGPARGIRCAQGITRAVKALGIEVRAGLHAGECELIDGKVGGIAVHIGARVAAEAAPGEVLVSSTVKDLVAGSGLEFEDRGVRPLKGVPGEWRLYALAG